MPKPIIAPFPQPIQAKILAPCSEPTGWNVCSVHKYAPLLLSHTLASGGTLKAFEHEHANNLRCARTGS